MNVRREIIDAHHHLWDLGVCRYPWLMEKGVVRFFGDPEPIRRNYLVADLRNDAARYEIAGSVHVQVGVASGDELLESQWLDSVSSDTGLPSALVAFCDLAATDAEQHLESQAAIGRVRGVRHIVGRSADEDASTGSDALLDDPLWRRNLSLLPGLGLRFDLQLIPPQLERAAVLLEKVPDLKVALCHCGSPWNQGAEGLASWRAGLERLAENPNVNCKISGLAMFNHNWTVGDIRPIVETCVEVFGPSRCMFGSNFPVDKLHKSWDETWVAYEQIAAQYSDADQRQLFCSTAARFYSIELSKR